ncbi:MAG: hypothetical protein RLZZ410_83 [Pseudomonadota bacterium]|jgi:ABC-type uncharacterized transport system permease subunit
MNILGHPSLAWLPSALYFLFFWKEIRVYAQNSEENQESLRVLPISQWLLLPLLLLHGLILHESIFTSEGFIFGFAQALSMMSWIGVTFFWFESWYLPVRGLRAMVLFAAGICSLLPVIFPGYVLSARAIHDPWFRSHFIVANIAYGLLSLAALHAILMHWQDRHLHMPTHDKANSFFAKWGQRLPSLMSMEHILFRIIVVGFTLLTLTVFSGLFFSQTLFGRALFWDHKTVFGILSWFMFAALLIARWRIGLRGLTAIRWVLGSFLVLLLAYVGSRFVLEVLLQR